MTRARPGNTIRCPECRHGCRISLRAAMDTALAAAGSAPAAGAGPPDVWAGERPFDPAAIMSGSGPARSGGAVCCKCGAVTGTATPRGTWAVCPEHGRRFDARTLKTARAVIGRLDAAARRERERLAAERARRDATAPRSLDETLDIAGRIGVIKEGITGTLDRLTDAPTPALTARAADMSARLVVLDGEIGKCARAADPDGAIDELEPYLKQASRAARALADEIDAARAEEEFRAARWEEQERLERVREAEAIERAETRALPPADPLAEARAYRRDMPSVLEMVSQYRAARRDAGACELPHRGILRPAATRIIRMANHRAPGNFPEREVRACAAHDAPQICTGHGFRWFAEVKLGRVSGV